jgi:16S rRNA G1207 methylase RsmC
LSASGEIWKSEALVHTYLESVRGAIPLAREQIDVLLRLVEARGAPVESIVDLGCGNGVLSMALLDGHPDAAATLVDHSEPMISEARSHLAAYASRCRFITADLSQPGWVGSLGGTGDFDVVVSG